MSIEHGEFSISLEGSIIKTKLMGSFNEFGAKRYTEAVIEVVKQLEGKPFAILVNNLELFGGTPEAYQVLEEYNKWVNQQHMLAKAFVFNAAILATIMKNMSPSMKADNIQMFKTLEDAESWLEAVLQQHVKINA
ncbi:hypothetical protein [Shewanella subflava]|uniref:STAS/SEC14 domain-containing protein n=1 Tax=Shewanella subflava TaxID=2986476 RepID=A0ABT3I652_9GAMM|nr:hypothetical protein [Shewanella subflava]MCW3171554.1 hypothetical protein [Shewanella subflava]